MTVHDHDRALCERCGKRPVRQIRITYPDLVEFCEQCINNAKRDLREQGVPKAEWTEAMLRGRLERPRRGGGTQPAPAAAAPNGNGARPAPAPPDEPRPPPVSLIDVRLLRAELAQLEEAHELVGNVLAALKRTCTRLHAAAKASAPEVLQ